MKKKRKEKKRRINSKASRLKFKEKCYKPQVKLTTFCPTGFCSFIVLAFFFYWVAYNGVKIVMVHNI
jgi:hypothetical protein